MPFRLRAPRTTVRHPKAGRQHRHGHFRKAAGALKDVVCVAQANVARTASLDFAVVLNVQTRQFLCIPYRFLADSG